ncbi:HAD hydrolase-like protein [Chitinophagaceae bacterium MMS25-I14]
MAIKLVVFDMAGTTVEDNNNVAEVLQYALGQFGYNVSIDAVNKVMGYPKPVAIRELAASCSGEAVSEELVTRIHNVFVNRMLEYYRQSPVIREKEGVRDTFLQLKKQKIKIGIDTGFSRDIADTIIERLGWKEDGLFDVSITSDEVDNGRPYPDMIYRAMELASVEDAAHVAKVGDTASDLQEGSAAGCKYVIGVTSGAYAASDLQQEPHTHLIHHLYEVVEIVS